VLYLCVKSLSFFFRSRADFGVHTGLVQGVAAAGIQNAAAPAADETWFEVYKVAPQTFAIYEPHQSGRNDCVPDYRHEQAVLFDTAWASATSANRSQTHFAPSRRPDSTRMTITSATTGAFPRLRMARSSPQKRKRIGRRRKSKVAPSEICGEKPSQRL